MGKSARDNLDKNTTYDQCCQKFLNGSYESNKLHMICPNCCQNLQRLYSLEKDAKELTEKLRHTWYKTKRLNRARHTRLTPTIAHESLPSSPLPTIASDENIIITVKEELDIESVPSDSKTSIDQSPIAVSDTVLANNAYDLSYTQRTNNNNNNKIFEPKLSHRSNGRTSDELNNLPAKPHVSLTQIQFKITDSFVFVLDEKTNAINVKDGKIQSVSIKKISFVRSLSIIFSRYIIS